jgi:hypothetical protein
VWKTTQSKKPGFWVAYTRIFKASIKKTLFMSIHLLEQQLQTLMLRDLTSAP